MRINLFLFAFLFISSCTREVEVSNENVRGIWKVSAFENDIPGISKEVEKAGEVEFLSSVYTLNEDFSMEMHSDYFRVGASGHWELNPETKEISMYYSYDSIQGNETYNISYLSKNKMILHQVISAGNYNGYVELTLEK